MDITSSVLLQTTSGSLSSNQLEIVAYFEKPIATLTDDTGLRENWRLDSRTLCVNLSEEKFKDYTTLQPSDFILVNYPTGLSIQSVTGNSPTRVTIALQFNGTDFDTNYYNFHVDIPYTVLVQTTSGYLSTTPMTVFAYIENPVATLTADSVLNEKRLDYRVLTINLSEEKFINYTELLVSDFTLMNAPDGLSIESINPISPREVQIALQFDGTDFEVNIPNFYVNISSSVLVQTTTGSLSTSFMTIFPFTTDATAILTADSALTEYTLDFRTLYIDLSEAAFIHFETLEIADFTLVNYPTGLSIGSVTGISPYRAMFELQFLYNDFDTAITDFFVTIDHNQLVRSTTDLKTNTLCIGAYAEVPVLLATPDSALHEFTLSRRRLFLELTEEKFLNYLTLVPADFQLINAPTGLTVESVTGISRTSARIDLAFNRTDFDADITNMKVGITKDILLQSNISDLVSNNLTVYACMEQLTSWHGITGYDGPAVNIYPNPAKEYLTVDLGAPPKNPVLIRLYDISGKCILEEQIPALQQETTLHLGDLKHGLYIIDIRKKNSFEVIHHGKMIVN